MKKMTDEMNDLIRRGYVEDFIKCPYCKEYDVDERREGIALCNKCHRMIVVETRSFHRSRRPSEEEMSNMKPLIGRLRKCGFEIQ
jgi:hypothetical protein